VVIIKQNFTEKQSMFIDEYIISLNATKAAIKAGYSQKRGNKMGIENLSKVVIKEEIAKRMEELYLKNRDQVKKFIVWRLAQHEEPEPVIEDEEEEDIYVSNQAVELLAEKFQV
jgi:phage terminase small subunit